ncbi:exo-alpha-sialidase [Planctomicrobium sp. SH661]|uniref:exo-alpha-sialidase n=1 Tax=Planctomicrobium sp. SH661 TaxID=3448124 RepID=UPI003F5CB4D3
MRSSLKFPPFVPTALATAFALLLTAFTVSAGPVQLHPRGVKLPTDQQGPFVTTADGGVLCISGQAAHHSLDEGKTWSSVPLFKDASKYGVSGERALLRTRDGVIISAWMNMKERSTAPGGRWGGPQADYDQWILPTYVARSLDDGKTWEEPQLLHRPWCGCIHSLIQLKSGRIVLVGQTIIPEWRHATITFYSDDDGKTWQASNILDYGVGRHDHAGSCEATILERQDGSIYMLLRTESGYFFEATSSDQGKTWENLQKSGVRSVTCCGQLGRLSDGRAFLLWNHPIRSNPEDGHSRYELSIAFSSDDGKTWHDRTVIASRYPEAGDPPYINRASYPYLYERKPGELWITTMQGDIRLKISSDEIAKGEFALPETIVFLGDSTTARRPGAVKEVTAERIAAELKKSHPKLLVSASEVASAQSSNAVRATGFSGMILNSGVPGSNTNEGLKRLKDQLPSMKPRLVVVQFGINDACVDVWQNPPATAPRVDLEKFKSNLREMVQLSRKSGADVILMTANPVRWSPKFLELYGKPPYDPKAEDGFESLWLTKYNDAVKGVAQELDVPLVDIHAAYLNHAREHQVKVDTLLLDGVHPNDDGHAVTTAALSPVVQQVLSK